MWIVLRVHRAHTGLMMELYIHTCTRVSRENIRLDCIRDSTSYVNMMRFRHDFDAIDQIMLPNSGNGLKAGYIQHLTHKRITLVIQASDDACTISCS